MKKRVTIQDLANELNTTPSTISRALRNHPGIGEAMKEAVKKMAEKYDYQPNTIASGLRSGKSNTLGVIVPRVNRDFFSSVISAIEDVVFKAGYNVIICQTHDRVEKEKQYINTLLNGRVDGILVSLGLETKEYRHFEKVIEAGIPLIFFDRICEEMDVTKIMIDDFDGSFKAVSHLVKMGYNRIAHFSGPDFLNVYRNRKEGYIHALEKNNLKIDERMIIQNDLTIEAGKRDAERLMKMDDPPDAIFSASDYSALGALLYLKEMAYEIPGQIGVVGFSNEKFTSLIDPGLTSVDQHSDELGKYCAELFLEEVNRGAGNFVPRKIILNPNLLIRKSSWRKIIG